MARVITFDGKPRSTNPLNFEINPTMLTSGEVDRIIYGPRTVLVSANGNGDFTSLKEALDYVYSKYDTQNIVYYVVLVETGTYVEDPFAFPPNCIIHGLSEVSKDNPTILLKGTEGNLVTLRDASPDTRNYLYIDNINFGTETTPVAATGVINFFYFYDPDEDWNNILFSNCSATLYVGSGDYAHTTVLCVDSYFEISNGSTFGFRGFVNAAVNSCAFKFSGGYGCSILNGSLVQGVCYEGTSNISVIDETDTADDGVSVYLTNGSYLRKYPASLKGVVIHDANARLVIENINIYYHNVDVIGGVQSDNSFYPSVNVVSTANVSSPPTSGELGLAFGNPASHYPGWTAILNDNNASAVSGVYLVTTDKKAWYYTILTKAQ